MNPTPTASRRTVLAATAGVALAGAAPTAAAQDETLDEFLSNADTYDGVVDRTGEDEVRVSVGAGDLGLQFDPAAIRVDAGTTVVWEWTGEGGAHDVTEVGVDDGFASQQTDEAGHTFSQTFEVAGEHRYVCTPHEGAGMRGAVLVAPPDPTPAVEEHVGDVDSYDGIVDRRGEEEVRVSVGAGDVGLRFDPTAIRVDPGATVVWEWTGEGGDHNVEEVEAEDGFESELTGDAGHTFTQTFEEPGHHLYVCDPHAAAGMRGAVVVGDAGADDGGAGAAADDLATVGTLVVLLLAPVAGALALLGRELSETADRRRRRPGGA